MVYLRKWLEYVGWSFCLYVRTVPMRHWNGVNEICLILADWVLRGTGSVNRAAGDENWSTDSISVAHGTVIFTSHFDIDIIICTDYTRLSLIDVFGEYQLLTFCQYLNSALLQSCHQAFKFLCQFLQQNRSETALDKYIFILFVQDIFYKSAFFNYFFFFYILFTWAC